MESLKRYDMVANAFTVNMKQTKFGEWIKLSDVEDILKAPTNISSDKIADKLRKLLKPYIAKRPNAGCQVLFPLSELDNIVESATSHID